MESKGSTVSEPHPGLVSRERVRFEPRVLFSQRHRMRQEKQELRLLGDGGTEVIRCGDTQGLADMGDRRTFNRKLGELFSLSLLWPDANDVPL